MKQKLKDVKEDFYAFSSKSSDISRQLALAGIAIVWIFKTTNASQPLLDKNLIEILRLLVACLLSDFCHAFIPSIIYGIMNTSHRSGNVKDDDSEIQYSWLWNLPEWIFFVAKVVFLIWSYIELWKYLEHRLT